MWKWFKRLLRRSQSSFQQGGERILALEREVKSLQMALQERNQMLERLKGDLEYQRDTASSNVTEIVQTKLEHVFADAAAPVTQLLTQAHLLEEGKPVQSKDVLTVAKRLVRTLKDNGLSIEGNIGERVPFDPNRHEPLSANDSLSPEQSVIVRFVGVAYQGKLLRKAGVQKAKD
jgi:molecular chaperone GrpE (heat shock protein)